MRKSYDGIGFHKFMAIIQAVSLLEMCLKSRLNGKHDLFGLYSLGLCPWQKSDFTWMELDIPGALLAELDFPTIK